MIAVIFEVEPKTGLSEQYFDQVKELKAYLEKVPGFISVERFQSLSNEAKYVSLSFFENEQAVIHWRDQAMHQKAQNKGINQIFEHYRIRVASVFRDYSMQDKAQAPKKPNEVT